MTDEIDATVKITPLDNEPSLQDLHDVARSVAGRILIAEGRMPAMLWLHHPDNGTKGGFLSFTPIATGARENRFVTRLMMRAQLQAPSRIDMYGLVAPAWFITTTGSKRNVTIVSAGSRQGGLVSSAIDRKGRPTVVMSAVVNLFEAIES